MPDAIILKLLDAPAERRRMLAFNLPLEQQRRLCRDAAASAYDALWSSPARAVALAEVSTLIASRLPDAPPDRDIRALALAAHGNALRVAAEFPAAAALLHQADELAASGTGDTGLIASIFEQFATLRQDLRQFAQASALLKKAEEIHLQDGRRQAAARAVISQGLVSGYSGNAEAAVVTLTRAMRLLDGSNPRLRISAIHALAWFLVDMGQPESAQRCYDKAIRAGFYRILDDQPFQAARQTWLQGHIFVGLGRIAEAERYLSSARTAFAEMGQAQEAALSSLELAELLASQERWSALPALIEEILPIFALLGIHREARAARLLSAAAARRDVAARLIRCASAAVSRTRRRP